MLRVDLQTPLPNGNRILWIELPPDSDPKNRSDWEMVLTEMLKEGEAGHAKQYMPFKARWLNDLVARICR